MGKYILLITDRIIISTFYCLFFFLPLAYSGDTSEAFQLNKTWLLYLLTIIIAAAWLTKMCVQNKIAIRYNSFTIPLLLFLLSQTISTIISIDRHLSLWGSYGRFTGGYLSTLASIFLFYAFVSNVKKGHGKQIIRITCIAGCIVASIGFLAFFGYDSICSTIAATSKNTCWADPTGPQTRMFSTLGNPNWLAAYTSVIAILLVGYLLSLTSTKQIRYILLLLCTSLFYMVILLTGSRSGFIGFFSAVSCLLLCAFLINKKHFPKYQRKTLLMLVFILSALSVIIGTPFTKRATFIHSGIIQPVSVNGKEESIKTRQYLWIGTLHIFYHYPIFGSGVETFSQTFPQFRLAQHNMTHEWDFVYDKAHNEYLHLLATTGIFGFITYLFFIGAFLHTVYISLVEKQKNTPSLLPFILFSSWISILVTNFFGFMDATTSLFFYLLPALYVTLTRQSKTYTFSFVKKPHMFAQGIAICLIIVFGGYSITLLLERWYADAQYTLGYRYDQQKKYTTARKHLLSALYYWHTEPTFINEYAFNSSHLAVLHNNVGQKTLAVLYAKQANEASNILVANHKYSSELWEDRALLFHNLTNINKRYGKLSIAAAKQAAILSPTSAKYRYILALLYKDADMLSDAKKTLQETLLLKPNYTESKQMQNSLEQNK